MAFIAYLWMLSSSRAEISWTGAELTRLIISAFIPFGTFCNIGLLRRRETGLIAATLSPERQP